MILICGFTLNILTLIASSWKSLKVIEIFTHMIFSKGTALFFGFGILPYIGLAGLGIPTRKFSWGYELGLCALLVFDLCMRIGILFYPTNSTAAIGLLMGPVFFTWAVVPPAVGIGVLLNWVVKKRFFQITFLSFPVRMIFFIISSIVLAKAFGFFPKDPNEAFVSASPKKTSSSSLNQLRNQLNIKKEIYYEGDFLGGVREIQVLSPSTPTSSEISILGQGTIKIFENLISPKIKLELKLTDSSGNQIWFGLQPYLIQLKNPERIRILDRGGGFGEMRLLDEKGTSLWTIEYSPSISGIAFIETPNPKIWLSKMDGLYDYTMSSQKLQKFADGEFLGLESYHDLDLKKTTAVTQKKTGYQLWDDSGNLIKKIDTTPKTINFRLVWWQQALHAATKDDRTTLNLLNLETHIQKNFIFPNIPSYEFKIVSFRSREQNEYLAVLSIGTSQVKFSDLTIFQSDGTIVYRDSFSKNAGLAKIPIKDQECLLVGDGRAKVWKLCVQ